MDQTTLVNIDIGIGSRVLRALDEAGLDICVAMWLNSGRYEDWRLAFASKSFNRDGSLYSYKIADEAIDKAGISVYQTPTFLVMPTTDPFIRDLRHRFAKAGDVEGMRLGGQLIGDLWVNGAYVYRIK